MRCLRPLLHHVRLRRVVVAGLWTLLALCAGDALGTTLVPVDFPELVARSPIIVHATVVSSSSHWNADRTLILTDIQLHVLEALRGNPGGEITVTQLGGQVGKVRVDADGAAPFLVGEEVVLFLSDPGSSGARGRDTLAPEGSGARGAGYGLRLMGMSQGRFQVQTDARTGEKWIHGLNLPGRDPMGIPASGAVGSAAPDSGAAVSGSDMAGDSVQPSTSAKGSSRMELSGFLNDIRTRVREITPEIPREAEH